MNAEFIGKVLLQLVFHLDQNVIDISIRDIHFFQSTSCPLSDDSIHIAQIEAEAVTRAVERAEAILRERFSDADQRRLFDDYVTQVAKASMGSSQTRRQA